MARKKSQRLGSISTIGGKYELPPFYGIMLAEGNVDPMKTFATFRPLPGKTKALQMCEKWVGWKMKGKQTPKLGLFLFGGTGTGKTHLANAVAYRVIVDCGVFTKVLPTIRIPRNDQDALLDLTDPDVVPLLVLDDLGAERLTGRALECLYTIVSERLRLRAPMVVTTNYEPDVLREWLGDEYGDRLYGRLLEMCSLVPVGGDDMRVEGND